jgi:hypothetical protein
LRTLSLGSEANREGAQTTHNVVANNRARWNGQRRSGGGGVRRRLRDDGEDEEAEEEKKNTTMTVLGLL